MRKFIQQKLKDQKGLTLIELLAVIVILAIIAAIAIPAIGNIIQNSRVGAMKSDNLNAIAAAELYILEKPTTSAVTLENITNKKADGTESVAGAQAYVDDAGSLKTFSYDPVTKLVVSTAEEGNMNMKITSTGATKQQISNYANNNRAAENSIIASKGSLTTSP